MVIHAKKIGSGTLIGNGAVLNDEVTIGSNCIVAAGSVVIEGTDIPDNSIVTVSYTHLTLPTKRIV